jgi:hypothetical protein
MTQPDPNYHSRRKAQPICTGVLDYFPDALLAIAECSRAGNEQHSPGQPLHWAKDKSTDEPDALLRHLIGRGTLDTDGIGHSVKVAWRALALLQREIEAERIAGKTIYDDPDAQRPGEDAKAHRDRVNSPWSSAVAFENGPDRTPMIPTSLGKPMTAKSGGPSFSTAPAFASSNPTYQDLENYRRECRHDVDRNLPSYRRQYRDRDVSRQPDDFASDGL